MATQTVPVGTEAHDTFPINGTDYIEFYVGNAKQAAHYYRAAFGFQLVGLSRSRDRRARPGQLPARAEQDPPRADARRSARTATIAEHVQRHGDGVRDIALWVDDARDAFAQGGRARRRVRVRAAVAPRRRRRGRHRRRSRSTATRFTRSSSGENYRGAVHAGLRAAHAALSRRADRPPVRRPLRRQRRARAR